MPQQASTPWSTRSVAEGGTDSPVGDLVPVPNEITPVVNTGFIATTGKYTGIVTDDLAFTFQDPNQALAAGASIFINADMLKRDILIIAALDSSGNNVNVDFVWLNPDTPTGPYNTPAFTTVGINGEKPWQSNKRTGGNAADFIYILDNGADNLAETWQFYKIIGLRGTVGNVQLRSNEGSDAGTISTAYLRLV